MVHSVRVRTLFVRVVVLCAVVEAVEGVEPAVGGRVVPVAETQVPPADKMLYNTVFSSLKRTYLELNYVFLIAGVLYKRKHVLN